jgi:Uma2 family endonuclease
MTASPVEAKKVYTPEDVWQLSQQGESFELIDGELYPMAPSKLRHSRVAGRIATFIGHYALEHRLGESYVAEPGFQLPTANVLAPDVAFISSARLLPETDAPGFDKIAPDLAVEVMSESNTKVEMHRKVQLFFAAGTRLIWIVYPKSRTIYVYTAPDKITVLQGDTVIDGGDVLPGFSVRLADIFGRMDD